MRPPVSAIADTTARRDAARLTRVVVDRILSPSIDDAATLVDTVSEDLADHLAAKIDGPTPDTAQLRNVVNIALSAFVVLKPGTTDLEVRGDRARISTAFAEIVYNAVQVSHTSNPAVARDWGLAGFASFLSGHLPRPTPLRLAQ